MNRIVLQKALDDIGTETHYSRFGKNKQVTIAQDIVGDIHPDMDHKFLRRERDKLSKIARSRGLIPQDLHYGNIGFTPLGQAKIRDIGHSLAGDLEKFTTDPKIRRAVQDMNVVSPANRRLTMALAKEKGAKFAKGLKGAGLKSIPYLGTGLAAYAAMTGDSQAATDLLDPAGSTVANQETPESKKHFEEQRKYNTLRKLQRFGKQPISQQLY